MQRILNQKDFSRLHYAINKTGIIKDIDGFCSGSDAKSLIGAEADNAYNNLGSVERTIYDFFFLKFCYKKQSFDKDLEKYRQKLAAKIRSDYYKSGPERSGASSRRAHNLMYAKNEGDKSSFKSLGIDDFSNRSGTSGKLEAKDLLQYLYSEQMPGIIGEFQIPLIKLAQELYFFARGYNLKVSALKVAKVNGPRLSSSSSDETIMSIINAANYSQRIRLEIDEYIRMREAERMKNLKEKEEKDLEELAHTKLDEIDINDPEGRMRAQKAKTIYKEKMKKEEKEKNELAKQMGNMNLNGNAEVGDGVNSESDSDSESDDKKSETVPAAAVIERQANVPLSLLKDPSKRFTEEFQNADPLRTDFLKKRSVEEIERKKNLKIEEVLKDLEEKEDSRFDRTIVANWDLYDYLRNGLKMLRSGDLENTTQLEIVVDNYFPVIKSRLKSAEYFNQFVNSNDISAQIEGKNWARNMNPSFFRNKIGAGENGVGMINNENSINSQQNHQVAVNAEYEQKFANIAQHSFLISAQDEVEDDVILQERTRLKNIERRKNESSIFLNLNPSQITTEGIFRLFKLARTPYDDSIMKMYQTLFNIETGSTVSGGPNVVGVGHSSNNSNTVTNFNTDAKNKFDSIFDNSGEPKKAFSKKYPKTYHRDVRLFFELMRKDIVMPILGLQNPVFTRKELKEKFDKIQKVWDPFYNKSDKDDTFCKVPETERIPVRVLKYQVIHDVQTIPNDPNHVNVFYRDINLCGKIWDLANKVKIIAERLIGDLDLDYDYFIKFDSRSPTNLAPHNNINGTTEAQYRLLRRYQKLSHYHRMYLYSTKTVVAKMEQMNALTSDDFESIVNFETEFEREETEAIRALEFVSIALGLPRGYTTEDIEYFKEQFQNFNIVENKDIIWQPLLVREDVGGKLNSINKLNDPTYRCVFSVEADGEGIEGVNKIVSFEDFISIKDSAIEIAEKYVNTKWNKTITGKKNNNRISNSSNSSSDKSNNVQLFSGKGYTLGTDVETQLMIDGMNGINLGVNNNNNDPNRANHNDPMPMSPMTPNNEELIADNGFLLPTSIPEVLASHIESIFAPIRQEVSDALKELSKRILKHMRGPGGIDYSKYLGVSDDTDISGIHLWHARSSDNERLGLSDTNSDADSHYTVTGKMYTISDLPQLQAYAMGYSQAELLSMKKRRDKERTIRYSVCPGGGNTDLLMGIPKRLEAWATNDDPANDNIMPWYMNQSGYVNNLINSGDNHPLFTKAYLSSTIFLQHLEANLIKTLYRELVEIPEKKSLYRSEMKSSLLRFVPKNVYYAQPPFRNWASDMRNAENCMRDAATDSNKKKAESSITAEERIYLSKAEEKRNRNAEGRQDDTIIVGPAMVDGFSLHADKPQWFVSKNEYQQWIADNVKGICEEIIEMYQETVYIETVVTVRGTENQIKHKKASTNEDKAIYGDKYPMWAVVLWRMESNLRIKVLEKLKEWWNLKTQQNQNQHQSENQPDINNGPSRPLARPKQKKKPKRTAAESGSVPMDVDSESHTGAVPMDVTSGATVTSASSSSNANGTNTRSSANKDWNYLEIQSQLTELNDKNYISSSPDDCFHYVKIINLLPDEHTTTRFKQMCMDPADPKNRSSSSSSTATGPGGADPSSSNFIQGATGELVLYKKDLLLASFIWIQSFIVHALDTDAYNQLPNPKISAAAITTRDNDLHNSGNTNLLFAKIWKTGSAVCVGLAVFLHEVAKDLGYVESYIAEGFPKITSEIAMGTDVVFRNHQEIKGNPELALVHINEANHVWVEIRMDPITKEPYGTDDFSLARVNMSSEAKFRVTGGDTSGWFIFDCNWNKASDAINSSVPFFGIPAYMVRDMFYLKQGGHTGDYGSERKAYYTEKTPNQDPLQIVPAWNPAYSKDIFRTRPCLMPWFYELQRRYKFQFHGSFIDYKDYQQNMIYQKDATTFILPRKNTTPKFYGTEFPSPTTNPTVDSDNINNATNVFNGSANVTSFEDTKFGKAFHSHYKLLGDKDSQWISSGTGLYSPDGPSEGALYGSDPIWGQNYGYSFATATSSSAADGTTNIEKSKPRSIPDRPEWGNRFFIDGVDRNLKRTLLFSSRGMKQPSRVSASARCWAETQMDKEKNKFEKYLGDSTVVTLDLRKIDEEMRHELGSNIDSIPDKIKIDKSTDLNIYQLHLDFAKTIDYYDKYKQVINRCILDIQAEALEDQFALKGRAAIMQMIVRFSN